MRVGLAVSLLVLFQSQVIFAQRTVSFLRETPVYATPDSSKAPVLGAAKESTADLVGIEGAWLRISFEDSRGQRRVGYVQSQFVIVVTEAPQEPDTRTTPPAVGVPVVRNSPRTEPAASQRTPPAAPAKRGKTVLAVTIVDKRESNSSYTYVAPATITGTSQLNSSCSGTATSLTPYSTNLNVNCAGSAASNTVINPSRQYGYSVTGATFALKLPDGRHVLVNCESKYAPRGDYINRRSCRMPLIEQIRVEFNGDKAKLMWPTSIDGRKTESETYKILAIFDAPTAAR